VARPQHHPHGRKHKARAQGLFSTRTMELDLQELQDAQDGIGWDKFMFGKISVLWQEIQAKTELRITLDKCAYTEDLASCIGPMGTQECDPA
jgi:hypothetical protein